MSDLIKVKDYKELKKIILDKIIPLDTIDTSEITNMSSLFQNISEINGDISNWDVSKVKCMTSMFECSKLNPDLSKWNVSSVTHMSGMFLESQFNGDISSWDVSNVVSINSMFENSSFNQDISKWNLKSILYIGNFVGNSPFYQNLGSWNLRGKEISDMFLYTDGLEDKYNNDRITFIENEMNRIQNAKSNVIPTSIPTPTPKEVDSLLDKTTKEPEVISLADSF